MRQDKIGHPEPRCIEHQVALTKDSNGYCPSCGHWSILTDVVIDDISKEKGDKCLYCCATFEASNLRFIDSQVCKCGHPKEHHNEGFLSCQKCRWCKKYRPTQVTVETVPR